MEIGLTWRVVWRLLLVTHEWPDCLVIRWVWRIWWFFGYRWIYPFMRQKKREGCAFAQPFGEGEYGVRLALGAHWKP